MSDLISRQAVIDRINRLIEVEKKQGTDDLGYGRERVNAYETMLHFVGSEYLHPSVEPEIEKCDDCISRIDILKKLNNLCNNTCEYSKIQRKSMCDACNLDLVFDMINNAKAVEPERKTGKWIERPLKNMLFVRLFKCDCCNKFSGLESEYCPRCGAKMEAADNAESEDAE